MNRLSLKIVTVAVVLGVGSLALAQAPGTAPTIPE